MQVYKLENLSKPVSELKTAINDTEYNKDLVFQVVNSYIHERITTKDTKNRSEVRGGGRKPRRQKGTGGARVGTIRSPLWVGGGITFNHSSRECSHKVNKKMYRKAIAVILSELNRKSDLVIVDGMQLDTHKTKSLFIKIKELVAKRKVLMMTDKIDKNFVQASANIHEVTYGEWKTVLNPVDLCNSNTVVITSQAFNEIKEWLQNEQA
jgi:large subunit ribosomal protein L4